ncbi:MAG: hypothetical protein LBB21_00805 [Holosporaceae bacterium]|jgi:dihydrofolate synthase/folylpolyglutamate synthase|nr:hypothetical protein [Holosporaceae bacterium]
MNKIVNYLENQANFNDLNKVKQALTTLELKIDPKKVIIISGTNGKGTTCATLQTLLIESGRCVGFFSSPHLMKINERIKFNDENISDEDFCKIFKKIHKKVENFNLSYFEYLTLMACYYFFEVKKVDYAIFEVGLGGIFDATNVIPHDISVITRLGMDHEAVLGNNLLDIAKNKFGIISDNNIVFHTKFDNDKVKNLAKEVAEEHKAKFIEAYKYECLATVAEQYDYPDFFINTSHGIFRMSLQGKRAAENMSLAITIYDCLIGDVLNVIHAVGKVNWPGRMEKIEYKNRDIFLSGDHNPQGIKSLLEILRYYNYDRVHFVIGVCSDKNHRLMLEALSTVGGCGRSVIYLTETPVKTTPLKDYDKSFLESANFSSPDQIKALDAAISNAKNEDLIIVTGSLYLVGKICHHITTSSWLS